MLVQTKKKDFLFITFIIMFLYFLAGKLSFYFAFENSIVTTTIFFPEGIVLALVLLYGKRIIPGIFLGQFILALNIGLDISPAFFIAITNALEAFLALYLSKKFHFDKKLLALKDIYFLFFMIIFILQPFSALLGTFTLFTFSLTQVSFLHTMFLWWFGNSMGQLLLVPMILILYENRKNTTMKNILFIIISFALINYYLIIILEIKNIALLFSIMIPLIILIARYIGLHYAGIAVLVITISSLYMSRVGIGIFTTDTTINNLININFYILAHIIILYMHGVLMTEKEIIVAELAEFNEQLVEKVKREVEINREKERFLMQQSRMAQLGEMIALIAHQWKQPLNTLSIITSRINSQYFMQSLTDKKMKHFHKNSQTQIIQMTEVLDTFKDFFKPEKQKQTYEINASIDYILEILNPVLEEKSIFLQTNISENIFVEGFQNEFAQVILNIVNNAKDALLLKDKNFKKQIWIDVEKKKENIIITIEDNAGGIPNEIIDQIFNPYFSTKTDLNGTGLGLYIAKVIIEKHMGGSLSFNNTSKGAQFIIVL